MLKSAMYHSTPDTEPRCVYPLVWPPGQPRATERKESRFSVSFSTAYGDLLDELRKFDAHSVRISMNVPARADATPIAAMASKVTDPGVAAVFIRLGNKFEIACDNFRDVRSNVRALGATIECLRRIEQYGAPQLQERAMTGFRALPAPGTSSLDARPWHVVLGVSPHASAMEVEHAFKSKAMLCHPDRPGGSSANFAELCRARLEASSRPAAHGALSAYGR